MYKGLFPILPDKDYDFRAVYGTTTSFPDEYFTDAGLTCPDQNRDGHPEGCVRYATTEICNDEDKVAYDVGSIFTGMAQMGTPVDQPADIRDGLKAAILFGIGLPGEVEANWVNHRRGAYYRVDVGTGMDRFDITRSAMLTYAKTFGKPASVSVGSLWYPEFNSPQQGILPAPMTKTANRHNYKICGWTQKFGAPYLIVKPWEGKKYGIKIHDTYGLSLMSRETYNKLLDDYFSASYIVAPFNGDKSAIRLEYLEYMMYLLRKMGISGNILTSLTQIIQKAADSI